MNPSIKGLSKDQKRMFGFFAKYPGLHEIARDRDTQRIARSLVRRGLLAVRSRHKNGQWCQLEYVYWASQATTIALWYQNPGNSQSTFAITQ